jgi:hypothetical protein
VESTAWIAEDVSACRAGPRRVADADARGAPAAWKGCSRLPAPAVTLGGKLVSISVAAQRKAVALGASGPASLVPRYSAPIQLASPKPRKARLPGTALRDRSHVRRTIRTKLVAFFLKLTDGGRIDAGRTLQVRRSREFGRRTEGAQPPLRAAPVWPADGAQPRAAHSTTKRRRRRAWNGSPLHQAPRATRPSADVSRYRPALRREDLDRPHAPDQSFPPGCRSAVAKCRSTPASRPPSAGAPRRRPSARRSRRDRAHHVNAVLIVGTTRFPRCSLWSTR